jgi:hypothetical protein
MAYVNSLRTTGAAPGPTMTRRAHTAQHHDPTHDCNICVATVSSRSKPEPTPCHRDANAQRRARLDELAEARRQLGEELALLHQEPRMDAKPRDRRPAQDVPVQGEPHEGNDDRRERRLAADQPRGRAPTPLARGPSRDNNRYANEGANIDANADADALPLF